MGHRTPRFRRTPDPRRVQLTVRYAHLIRLVHKHRLLRSDHMVELLGGPRQPILRRLQLLYHHGHLDRPLAQLGQVRHGGSRKMVYALGNAGAEFLHTRFGLPRLTGNWTDKNRSVKRLFLEHTLAVADFMVRLECPCRRYPDVRLLEAEAMSRALWLGPTPPPKPFRWRLTLKTQSRSFRLGVVPDHVFGLQLKGINGADVLQGFFLEVDRGTMPIKRSNLIQTSIYRKLLAYYVTWRQQPLAINRFRVITVTTTPERLQGPVAANHQLNHGKGSGVFLFADAATVGQHPDLLTLPFRCGNSDDFARLLI